METLARETRLQVYYNFSEQNVRTLSGSPILTTI